MAAGVPFATHRRNDLPSMTAPTDLLAPPLTPRALLPQRLRADGFAILGPRGADGVEGLLGVPLAALEHWRPFWDRLPADGFLRDGGHYRQRRHGCYIVDGDRVAAVPHRPHWQPVEYNARHGGIERRFEPIEPALAADPLWLRWIARLAAQASALKGAQRWYVEAHPFRIDTTGGIGRPTPEGAHRDGVELVTVTLMARVGIKGGETRVFQAQAPEGLRFTLTEPWTTMLMDDARVIHESTPIQPLTAAGGGPQGHRDTLVLTFRAGGFQGPAGP